MRSLFRSLTVIGFSIFLFRISNAEAIGIPVSRISASTEVSACTPSERVGQTVFLQCYYREENRYTKSGYLSHVVIQNAGSARVIYSVTVHTDDGDKKWSDWPMDPGDDRDISIDTARISGIHIEYRPA